MCAPLHCTGTLLQHDVPADGRFPAAAVLQCSDCGEVFITGTTPDERHHDAPVMTV
jgi:hypothetical protein